MAIVGAVWAALFPVSMLWYFTPPTFNAHAASQPPETAWWQIPLAFLAVVILLLGVTAPFGTTLLGAISISQIRHSAGRLYGLGLAVFDALLFPLLALYLLILTVPKVISAVIIKSTAGAEPSMASVILVVIAAIFAIILALLLDFLIIRWAWRAANRPVGRSGASGGLPASQSGKGRQAALSTPEQVAKDDAIEEARLEVNGPAIGLLVTGILNLLAAPLVVLTVIMFVGLWDAASHSSSPFESGTPNVVEPHVESAILRVILLLVTIGLVPAGLSTLMIVGALKMKRLKAYGLAVAASILAIVSPACLVGLPIGVWALAVLSQRDVRAAFERRRRRKPA